MQAVPGPMLNTTGYAAMVNGYYAPCNHWENQDLGTYPPPPAQRDVQVALYYILLDQNCSWFSSFIIQPVLRPMLGTASYTTASGNALCNPWENLDMGTYPPPPARRDTQVTLHCTFYLTRTVQGSPYLSRRQS
jgi:hypothetical protein